MCAASAAAAEVFSFRVHVPATSANLGPGFDTLGLALAYGDDLTVRVLSEPGVRVDVVGVGAGEVPADESNLVVQSAAHVFRAVGRSLPGLHIAAENRIPHGRGMGSSGSAIVAGVVIAAAILARDARPLLLSGADILKFATEIEGHPDNVAPAIFGGLTISWMDGEVPRFKRLEVAPSVLPLVAVPSFTMSTAKARSLQPAEVPLADAVFNVSRAALLIAAVTQDPSLLFAATADRLHQGYRGPAMPETARLVARLRDVGLAAVVSGAGPSVLVLAQSQAELERAQGIIAAEFSEVWRALALSVDLIGATVDEVPVIQLRIG